jgi:hypothetical protein
MKKLKVFSILLACLMALGFVLMSCEDNINIDGGDNGGNTGGNNGGNNGGDGIYTHAVWTTLMTYYEFTSLSGWTLQDDYYLYFELGSDYVSQRISQYKTNANKHVWTENQVRTWFIGRGFGTEEAYKATAWFITSNHGCIAYRSGSVVNMIQK